MQIIKTEALTYVPAMSSTRVWDIAEHMWVSILWKEIFIPDILVRCIIMTTPESVYTTNVLLCFIVTDDVLFALFSDEKGEDTKYVLPLSSVFRPDQVSGLRHN